MGDIASPDEQVAAKLDIEALSIPPGLTDEELQQWTAVSLLTTPFASAVIGLQEKDPPSAARVLAEAFGLDIVVARRDMETVHNWLAFLAPEVLRTP